MFFVIKCMWILSFLSLIHHTYLLSNKEHGDISKKWLFFSCHYWIRHNIRPDYFSASLKGSILSNDISLVRMFLMIHSSIIFLCLFSSDMTLSGVVLSPLWLSLLSPLSSLLSSLLIDLRVYCLDVVFEWINLCFWT